MARELVAMTLQLEYDRHLMSDAQHEKIVAIMRRAAAEVIGKGALLANPNVLSITALEWDHEAGADKPMDIRDYQPGEE